MGAVALAMLALTTSAQAITVDGSWNDWFTSALSAPSAAWWYNSAGGPAGENAPIAGHDTMLPVGLIDHAGYALDYEWHGSDVYGGAEDNQDGIGNVINTQAYDIEAIMALVQQDVSGNATLYLGIVTGMVQGGQNVSGTMIYGGDVFVNFDGDSTYDHAVRINNAPGSTGVETLFSAPMGTSNPTDFTVARPYRVASGGSPDTDGAEVAWSSPTVHNFVEMSFGMTAAELTNMQTYGLGVHWTVTCGNDVFNPNFRISPRPPTPEPSTIVLLGIGMIGLALRKKFSA